jgi:hypothetical protein
MRARRVALIQVHSNTFFSGHPGLPKPACRLDKQTTKDLRLWVFITDEGHEKQNQEEA